MAGSVLTRTHLSSLPHHLGIDMSNSEDRFLIKIENDGNNEVKIWKF